MQPLNDFRRPQGFFQRLRLNNSGTDSPCSVTLTPPILPRWSFTLPHRQGLPGDEQSNCGSQFRRSSAVPRAFKDGANSASNLRR
jgi:hypothetical protein